MLVQHERHCTCTNATTRERDTRAIASIDCKLLTTATKVEAVLDVEREAKVAKEMPKRIRFCFSYLTPEH